MAVPALSCVNCATWQAMRSPSGHYDSYIEKNVQVQRIFDRGRELAIAKVLPVTAEFIREQGRVSPIEHPYWNSEKAQIVVALNVTGREPIRLKNWRFLWNGQESTQIHEISDAEVIEREYNFAYPFYRVYIMTFDDIGTSNSKGFEILCPYGRLAFQSSNWGQFRSIAGHAEEEKDSRE